MDDKVDPLSDMDELERGLRSGIRFSPFAMGQVAGTIAALRAALRKVTAERDAMNGVTAELDAARGRVKPMRFEQCAAGMWSSGLVLGGEYRIKLVGGKGYQISRGMLCVPDCTVWHETLDLAIAAAQADYTARILAALEGGDAT